MPDVIRADQKEEVKNFSVDIPMATPSFFLRGSTHLDWGMKNRLSRIFNPTNGRTVMLAFDHGYFMGPTSGLERAGPGHPAAAALRGLPHVYPRGSADVHTAGGSQTSGAALQHRDFHPQGAEQ